MSNSSKSYEDGIKEGIRLEKEKQQCLKKKREEEEFEYRPSNGIEIISCEPSSEKGVINNVTMYISEPFVGGIYNIKIKGRYEDGSTKCDIDCPGSISKIYREVYETIWAFLGKCKDYPNFVARTKYKYKWRKGKGMVIVEKLDPKKTYEEFVADSTFVNFIDEASSQLKKRLKREVEIAVQPRDSLPEPSRIELVINLKDGEYDKVNRLILKLSDTVTNEQDVWGIPTYILISNSKEK